MAITSADLDALDAALATGELSVRFDSGRSVTYRSIDELLKARTHIARMIDSTSLYPRRGPRYQVAVFDDA